MCTKAVTPRTASKMELPSECTMHMCCSPTKHTGKLFEVDKAMAVLIHQSECPQCNGVSVCTVRPGAQEMAKNPELLAINSILLQIWQAGIVVF